MGQRPAPYRALFARGIKSACVRQFDDLPGKYHWALPLLEYNNAETLWATFESKVIGGCSREIGRSSATKGASSTKAFC
jgi:hypothetical protein